MDIDKACEIILPRFKTISKEIWGDVVDKMTITCELKTMKTNNLASLSRDSRCNPQAIDNHLYRYCKEYTLQLSPRLLELPDDRLEKVLKHESIHMGYFRHDRNFLDLASKVGATFSEASFDTPGILIEVRGSNGRYHTVMTAQNPEEARRLGRKYHFEHPDQRVRITY